LQDIEETEEYKQHQLPPAKRQVEEPSFFGSRPAKGFVVRDAPWSQQPATFTKNDDEFPDLGGASAPRAPSASLPWGPTSKR